MSSGAKFKAPLPDFKLKALDKLTEQKSEVGAGWRNQDGSISIRLNLCTVLHSSPNLVLTLFPNDSKRNNYVQAAEHLRVSEDRPDEAGRQPDQQRGALRAAAEQAPAR